MAKEVVNYETKQVSLSQIREDLKSGLARWKKDDIGFGSLEKKYNLTLQEMVALLAHPKIINIETRIPTFVIIDDIEEEEVKEPKQEQQTRIEVVAPVRRESNEKLIAFI